MLVMSPSKLIAARDPQGFRPLVIGRLGEGYVFASETCALDAVGAEYIRDVQPGEIVLAGKEGLTSITDFCGQKHAHCIFEYIYFARPDSQIDGLSIYEARQEAGRMLARQHPVEADLVIGVPESGIDAAIGYSQESGIPYGKGFVKNNYVGRTFIQPAQGQRENSVRLKLNVLATAVKGKRVVMLDAPLSAAPLPRGSSRCSRTLGPPKSMCASALRPFAGPAISAPTCPNAASFPPCAIRWRKSAASCTLTAWVIWTFPPSERCSAAKTYPIVTPASPGAIPSPPRRSCSSWTKNVSN